MSDAGGAFNVTIIFGDGGSSEDMAKDLQAALTAATGMAAKHMAKALAEAVRDAFTGPATTTFRRSIDKVVTSAVKSLGNLQDRLRDIEKALASIGSTSTAAFKATAGATDVVAEDVDKMRRNILAMARDPALAKALSSTTDASQRMTNEVGRNARKLAGIEQQAHGKTAEQFRVDTQAMTTAAKSEAAERIVAMQTEAAREVALTKKSTQTRVELIRAAISQIRALERGLSAVFRGTAQAIGGAFRGLGSGLNTILSGLTSRLRRTNAEMTTGLDTALDRRETILRSSFTRQEQIISRSVQRQQILNSRVDQQLSRGVAGAVTGRSRLGQALGLGAAFGGGFALIGGLRNMIGAAQDFEQSLAVLQAQMQLNDRQMERVRQTAIELGNDISLPGVSAKDAGDAINLLTKQFGSLGKGSVPAARAAAKGVLQLSRATQASAEDSAQLVGTAVNVFGIEAGRAVEVADQVTGALTKAAGVGFSDFSLAFRQAATVFAQFQVPAVGAGEALVDFNTAIAVLARGGLVGSDAGTSLKQFFLQANRGTKDSVKNLKLLTERAGETGTAFFDASGKARPLEESLAIMREGLQGLTDQERNKTLQKIFGSDAIRAANILLGTSEKTFDTIEKGVRRAGVAAEIAAAQNTGLRGAMDALRSVVETQIIKLWRPLNKALGNVVLAFANFFNLILTADEGPFKIIRDGLQGIAIGLGAVLAVKAGVDVIKLLATTLPALLTPFGLFAVAAAALGAAFVILRNNSEGFRDAIGRMGDVLGDFGERIATAAAPLIEFFQERFQQVIDFFRNDVGPSLENIGQGIGEVLVGGLQAAVNFITNTVIPGIRAFIDFVPELLTSIKNFFVRGFDLAAGAVVAFWGKVEPIIRPLIEGFKEMGDALADLITNFDIGDLAKIGGVLAASLGGFALAGPIGAAIAGVGSAIALLFSSSLGEGLLDTLGNIGGLIINALNGPLTAVKEFITGFFTLDNLKNVLFAFLDLVEQIGFIIGNIVTDPRVLAVIAGFAALAVTVAARFIQGLGRGVLDNLPEFGRLLLEGLKKLGELALDGLKEVFTNPALFVGVLGGILTGAKLISLFRQAGQSAGTGFLGGFRQVAFSGALAGGGAGSLKFLGGPGAFVTALIGGPGSIQNAVDRELRRTITSAGRRISEMRSVLRIAGQDIVGPRLEADVRKQFDALSKTVGPSGIAGLQLRAAFRATFESIRTLSLAPLRDLGKSTFGAMTAIGKSMAGALAAGFAGFQTGKALGGQSVMEQVLGVGGLALGIGAINVPAGIAAGALGILGVAMGNMGGDAEEAEARVRALTDAMREAKDPVEAFSAELLTRFGELDIEVQRAVDAMQIDLTEVLTGVGPGVSLLDSLFGRLKETIPGVATALEGVNLQSLSLKDIFADPAMGKLEEVFRKSGISADEFQEFVDLLVTALGDYTEASEAADIQNRVFGDGMSEAERNARNAHLEFQDAALAAERAGDKGEGAGQKFRDLFGGVPDFLGSVLDTGLSGARSALETLIGLAETSMTRIEELFQIGAGRTTLQEALDNFVLSIPSLAGQLESVLFPPEGTTVSQQFLEATKNNLTDGLVETLGDMVLPEIQAGDIKGFRGINRVVNQMTAAIQAEIDAGTIKREVGETLIANLRGAVDTPAFRRRVERALERQREIRAKIRVRAALEAAEVPPAEIRRIMREKFGPKATPAFPLLPTLEIPQGINPKFIIADIPPRRLARLIRRATRGGRGQKGPEVEFPFQLVPKPELPEDFDPATEIADLLSPTRISGGGGSSGPLLTIQESVEVPIPITPVIEVSETSGADAAEIGQGIAALIALGVVSAAGQISQAIGGAIAVALRSGATATAGFARAGAATAQALARGIASQSGASQAAGQAIALAAAGGATTAIDDMARAGRTSGASYASGVATAGPAAAIAGAVVAASADSGASGVSLYDEGQLAAAGFALGVLSGTGAAYRSGYALGQAAERGARDALASQSPSKVFRNIGRDVGEGFALGIADSGGDISSAMQQAVDEAIEAAQNAQFKRVARAEGAAALFDAMQPSALPGGPTLADVIRALDDARSSIADFHHDLTSEIQGLRREEKEHEKSLREKLSEKLDNIATRIAERAATLFGRREAGIDIRGQEIALGGLRQQVRRGIGGLLDDINQKIEEADRRANDASLTEEQRARAAAERDRLIARRRDLREQIRTLDINSETGRAASQQILDFGQQIRALGQSMLENGATAGRTAATMRRYRDQLIRGALAAGVSRREIMEMIRALGLSDTQLSRYVETVRERNEADRETRERLREEFEEDRRRLRRRLADDLARIRTLDQNTAAGRQNRAAILDQIQSIREYGAAALRAGTPVATVINRMKALRDRLVQSARSLGLPIDRVRELIRVMGLSNAQIAEFVEQLEEMNDAIPNVPPPPGGTPPPGAPGPLPGPLVGQINISVPYGDPEAISLAVANRVAFFAA